MALIHSLMRYKGEGRIVAFDMHENKKATIHLPSAKTFLVYMSKEYIIGESEVAEAAESPTANFLIYNSWDTVAKSASEEAKRLGIEVHNFGAFGYRLDELNG